MRCGEVEILSFKMKAWQILFKIIINILVLVSDKKYNNIDSGHATRPKVPPYMSGIVPEITPTQYQQVRYFCQSMDLGCYELFMLSVTGMSSCQPEMSPDKSV